MARSITYNQSAAVVNIDGVIAQIMGDQFAYSLEFPEIQTRTVGVTTSVLNNKSDKGGILNIRLFAMSPTNDQLIELAYNQVRNAAIEFDVTILSTEGVSFGCNGCGIATPATIEGGGPEQVTRQWSLNYKEFEPDKSLFA